jgi:arylsulfatase A-like enzyme
MKTRLLILALLAASACTTTPVSVARPAPAAAARIPLVVLLVVDQMRTDYLDRGQPHFTGGLRRLTQEGAWFHDAAYPYLNTITCAGHSTIGTGTFPYRHGMVLNEWWSRSSRAPQPCTQDPGVRNIGYTGQPVGGDSARSLLAPTLAERLQGETGGRAVAMSLKPRSAITLIGHRATSVVWYDDRAGWTTSTAFTATKVDWLDQFIAANPVTADAGKTWDRSLPAGAYEGPDDAAGERFPQGWTRTFPHVLKGTGAAFSSQWQRSPFGDEYLGRMAAAVVDALQLGRGTGTDFLAVSFSSLDLVGHQFGPASHEVQDMVLRLDRTIGVLLDHLDQAVGRDRYVLAMSSDHGVGLVTEQVADGGRETREQVMSAVDRALAPILGEGKYAIYSAYTDLYLAPGVLEKLRQNPKALAAALAALKAQPGIQHAIFADELKLPDARRDPDPVKRAAALSYYPGRSGDIIIVPKPGWMLSSTSAATHGTLYWHDQHVPVIFYGPGVSGGQRSGAATPADVAPTLGSLAGVPFPTADGRPLVEAGRR